MSKQIDFLWLFPFGKKGGTFELFIDPQLVLQESDEQYFSLPMAPLSAEEIQHLNRIAIPWSHLGDQGLGQAKNWKGKRFTMEPCGCLFTAQEVVTPSQENKYRTGHWWYAVKVRSCYGVDRDCHYEHLPINPGLQ